MIHIYYLIFIIISFILFFGLHTEVQSQKKILQQELVFKDQQLVELKQRLLEIKKAVSLQAEIIDQQSLIQKASLYIHDNPGVIVAGSIVIVILAFFFFGGGSGGDSAIQKSGEIIVNVVSDQAVHILNYTSGIEHRLLKTLEFMHTTQMKALTDRPLSNVVPFVGSSDPVENTAALVNSNPALANQALELLGAAPNLLT
jgi:hypothetical protein